MEQNYRLTIAYDGSRFFGWERQPDKDTIQGASWRPCWAHCRAIR